VPLKDLLRIAIGANQHRLAHHFSAFLNWPPAAYPPGGCLQRGSRSAGLKYHSAARRPRAAESEPTAAMIRGNIAIPKTRRAGAAVAASAEQACCAIPNQMTARGVMFGGLNAGQRGFHQRDFRDRRRARPGTPDFRSLLQAACLAEPEESQNRENHNDHADQPEYVIHGQPTPRVRIGRFHEHPRPLTCPGRLPGHGTAYPGSRRATWVCAPYLDCCRPVFPSLAGYRQCRCIRSAHDSRPRRGQQHRVR
jgi:hypothetical protein